MSRKPSPARSQGAPVTSRRSKPRRTLSMTSAKSDASGRLTSMVEQYINDDKFKMSPLRRKSVLPDDTNIDAPRRASWWKRLDSSSRDVLEALDTNRLPDELLLEDYEFEVQKDKKNQSVPESSDNESVASIIVPQRRLFNQKKQSQGKFGDIMGSWKTLGKTNLEDQDKSIHSVPKNLFKQGQPKNRPVFPAALLNSTNKTINKTVEPEPECNKQGRNLFGQAGNKRKKNMFTDFVLSESEDDSEVQHKVFGFKKNDKRMSLASRNRRMPSLTPSVTTDIDIDDWNLLPSSTMIVNSSVAIEVSRVITDKDLELAHDENQDVTLTEPNKSLELESNKLNTSKNKQSLRRSTLSTSKIQPDVYNESNGKVSETKTVEHAPDDDQDATLTEVNESLKLKTTSETPKRQTLNRTRMSKSRKLSVDHNKTLGNEKDLKCETTERAQSSKMNVTLPEMPLSNDSSRSESVRCNTSENPKRQTINRSSLSKSRKLSDKLDDNNKTLIEEKTLKPKKPEDDHDINQDVNEQTTVCKSSIENQLAELHRKSGKSNKSVQETEQIVDQRNEIIAKEDMEKMEWNDNDDANENDTTQEDSGQENDEDVENDQNDDENVENEQKDDEDVGIDQDDGEDDEQEVSDQVTPSEDGKSGKSNKSEQETEQSVDQRSEISSKEDMEQMEWNDNDYANENDTTQEDSDRENDEDVENDQNDDENVENEQKYNEDVGNYRDDGEDDEQEVSDQVTPTKDVPNKSQKIVESSVEEEQIDRETEVVDVTPNATYDTKGRNRIKDTTQMKSPESVLKNMSRDNMSFVPIGRSTSFRRSRSPPENKISRPTLIPIQESIIGSDGSRNSSTEGSGWDSHRTTRKTLRQTFGKDFTPRKSLRALVMEKSAKRQTDVNKNSSKIHKTRNKTVLDEAGKSTTRVNETTNKTVLEEIRDRRVSNRNLSSDWLLSPKSPAPGVSAHHVPDLNISKPQISYKSVHEMNELGNSLQLSDRPEPYQAINDSGPEISIHASYGHGMSGDASDHEDDRSSVNNPQTTFEQRKSVKKSMPLETDHDMQEVLDYDPSLQEEATHEESSKEITENLDQQASALEASENEAQDVSDHEEEEKEDSEPEESAQDVEADESNREEDAQETEPEVEVEESEHEESRIISEPDSEHEESDERESDQEEQEQSQQEIEPESEQENHEDSQQEIEPESEDEEHDASQQEIEEVSEQEQSQESVNDISQQYSDQESDREMDSDNEQDNNGISDDDHVEAHEVERQQNSKRFTERVVFDNILSDQEIDYDLSERVSRQISDNEVSEQVSDAEMEDQSLSRVSTQDNHDVSVGTKKSLLLIQMQKIAQENMELRQKIREKVENSLKRKRDGNPLMSPMQPKIFSSMRRINKPEPKKPKIQPRKTTTITIGTLPKEFVDDLKYKPPKRFQPANAPWITKRLYKYLETKLEPKYDYRARVRAEELVQSMYGFAKLARRRDVAPQDAVDELKAEMARLNVVTTHFEFYEFVREFMPREIRIKVNPDIVNKIPMPRSGIFADILQSRPVADG